MGASGARQLRGLETSELALSLVLRLRLGGGGGGSVLVATPDSVHITFIELRLWLQLQLRLEGGLRYNYTRQGILKAFESSAVRHCQDLRPLGLGRSFARRAGLSNSDHTSLGLGSCLGSASGTKSSGWW